MASANYDTLAETKALRAAGIAEAHAEAIVSTVDQARTGLLTESRFDAAMEEVRAQFRVTESRFDAAVGELRSEFRAEFRVTNSRFELAVGELRSDMKAGFARQEAALAEFKTEIYRYLWIQGGSIIVILSSLYMLAETWSRG